MASILRRGSVAIEVQLQLFVLIAVGIACGQIPAPELPATAMPQDRGGDSYAI